MNKNKQQYLKNLKSDTIDVALYLLAEEIAEIERQTEFADPSERIALLARHRELLDVYQSEISRRESLNPYRTDHDW